MGGRPGGEVIIQASPTLPVANGYPLSLRIANAAFVNIARTALPAALDHIESQDREIESLKKELEVRG